MVGGITVAGVVKGCTKRSFVGTKGDNVEVVDIRVDTGWDNVDVRARKGMALPGRGEEVELSVELVNGRLRVAAELVDGDDDGGSE